MAIPPMKSSCRTSLRFLWFTVFLDTVGVNLVVPVLPYVSKDLGGSPSMYGLLSMLYGGTQLLGASLMGHLSDTHGRRTVLMLSHAGAALSYVPLGLVTSLHLLFLSRIPVGILKQSTGVAQAYIADSTDSQERAGCLGVLGVAMGLGMIVGPTMGGYLSDTFGYTVVGFVAAALFCVNVMIVYTLLADPPSSSIKAGGRSVQSLFRALRDISQAPCMGVLFSIRFLLGLSSFGILSIFSLYTQQRYGIDAKQNGYMMSYMGILHIFTQGMGVKFFAQWFENERLILRFSILLALSFFAFAWAPTIGYLYGTLIFLSLSNGVLSTVLTSTVTRLVPKHETGGVLGLWGSIDSFARMVAPLIASVMLERVGVAAPGIFGGIVAACATLFVHRTLIRERVCHLE